MELALVHPGDDEERERCSFCDMVFKDDDDRINTCTDRRCVSLCQSCYANAGNSVR